MTDYNDGKWHVWNGGDCPVNSKSVVRVTFSDGVVCETARAGTLRWDKPLMFLVIEAPREPREFWIERGKYTGEVLNLRTSPPSYSVPNAEIIHVREVLEDQEDM